MNKKLDVHPDAKGLIFDIDGTICDSMPVHYIAWRSTALEYGIDFTIELFQTLAGIPVIPTCEILKRKFRKEFDPVEFAERKEAEYEKNIEKGKPVEPVVDLIREYSGKLPMACGTGSCRHLSRKALEISGVSDYFEHIVTAEDVQNYKPHPETFLRAAELIKVEPGQCQVFEDGIPGIEAAKRAGMIVTDVTEYYTVTIGEELRERDSVK